MTKKETLVGASVQRMRTAPNMTRNMRVYIDAVAHLDDVRTDENRLKPGWAEIEKNLMAVNDRRWKALTKEEQDALVRADRLV